MCLQAREAGRLLQDKQALESRLKEMERILATVQDQRNELKQQYKARGLADVAMQPALRLLACYYIYQV